MKYVGIDLGTSNSVLATYDGNETKIWGEAGSSQITPSAIYMVKRGNTFATYYGRSAYNYSFIDSANSATLFKRFLGTGEKMHFKDANVDKTPIECSSEILKFLLSFLPEDYKKEGMGVVITVPAAFNQMKKNATLEAAKQAGIENPVLLQEPVAAIMSVMKNTDQKGNFVVYDLGGGTFDVSVAANINGTVNLLANGGIEMCGGRDIDRMIWSEYLVPYLKKNFKIPEKLKRDVQFKSDEKYKKLYSVVLKEIEKAKAELDGCEKTDIQIPESAISIKDEKGKDIFIDCPLSRKDIDGLITDLIEATVGKTKDIIERAGFSCENIDNIVFIGGPTNYKPLRDKVSEELGIKESEGLNPMTCVAEGASVFAESIDWESDEKNSKDSKSVKQTSIGLKFKYEARTSQSKARVMCLVENEIKGSQIELNSKETGWTSGKLGLKDKLLIMVPLDRQGENVFSVIVTDDKGAIMDIGEADTITITRTYGTIGSVVASHSIGIAVKEKLGGGEELEYMVMAGDKLPAQGDLEFRSDARVVSGSADYIDFQIWEGENKKSVRDNFPVGVLKISGLEFGESYIPKGAELFCHYKIGVGGDISLQVSIPDIEQTFKKDNFYCAQNIDTTDIEAVKNQAIGLMHKANRYSQNIMDVRLIDVRSIGNHILDIIEENPGSEDVLKCYDLIKNMQKILYNVKQDNLSKVREMTLGINTRGFNSKYRQYADEDTIERFESLTKLADNSIKLGTNDFDSIMQELYLINGSIYFYQDEFLKEEFLDHKTASSSDYINKTAFRKLLSEGNNALSNNDMTGLREIIFSLRRLRIRNVEDEDDETGGGITITKG
ncbi:MAG: Hsp70 family protein [Abditibacteriota bacterium]|nr:Hsp70 family protein [Abditibacteriota bacterium]